VAKYSMHIIRGGY